MLDALPLVFVLIGLVLYTVLAGADFGAGMWQLMSGGGEQGERIRDHCHHSMGPVWEANHVWLIFVLTVTWTAYPVFFGSVASTLAVALFIAALGIILRGASYALRSGAAQTRELRTIDGMFAVASLVTPFALGAAAGGIAAERVPVGNAAGNLITSWLNPTSILIGLLAVAFSAYLAAVYLAADAARRGETDLVEAFRVRHSAQAPPPAASRWPGSSSSTPTTTRCTRGSSTAPRLQFSSCRSWSEPQRWGSTPGAGSSWPATRPRSPSRSSSPTGRLRGGRRSSRA